MLSRNVISEAHKVNILRSGGSGRRLRLPWYRWRVANGLAVAAAGVLLGCGAPGPSVSAESPAAGSSATQTVETPAITTPGITQAASSEGGALVVTTTSPSVRYQTVMMTRRTAFSTRTVKDPNLDQGITRVRTRGVYGSERLTYRLTFVDGVQTARTLVGRVVVKAPVTQITVVGTGSGPACDPNYSGACVPIASDVDCAGGSGNGPAYVRGPVTVIGTDIYDLDRDGDGIGCE